MASPVLTRDLEKHLRHIVGRDAVLTEPGQLLTFESDALTAHRATPAAVVLVDDPEQLQRVVSALHAARVPFVPRGAGTGLSGGAVADGAVIIELSRLSRIVWIDAENRRARVQPGVINTQLATAVAPCGLMYAPDPSSQTACTLGGNVAENSGGPHCLKYGVTSNHIIGLTLVTPEGEVVELPSSDAAGYDLVGLLVGSEGTLGICSEIEVRLVPVPAAVETLLAHFADVDDASRAVTAIIAAGILPAALEMIDQNTLKAVEASVFAAGFPTDVAASLIVELDGPRAGLAEQAREVEKVLQEHGAREVSRAASDEDRFRFWKARKSAFGAMGRIGSDLLVQDATVPRSRIPDMLRRVSEVAGKYDLVITNVSHAGDGNLHPNIPYDAREPGVLDRVRSASREIMEACVAAEGTITGEHGVGVDKRKYMPLIYSDADLETMRWVKEAFDPSGLCNPGKVLPDPSNDVPASSRSRKASAGDVASTIALELGADCLDEDRAEFSVEGRPPATLAAPGTIAVLSELMKLASDRGWVVLPIGDGTWLSNGCPLKRLDLVVSTRRLSGSIEHRPDDLLASVRAGTRLSELNAKLAEAGQWWPLDPLGGGTVGATISTGVAGPLAPAYGSPRDLVLGLTLVRADGQMVKAGGKVVKNVAGYDMVRLYTGSWGTLGIIAEANLRLHALPQADETRVFAGTRVEGLITLADELQSGGKLVPAAAEIVSPAAARALELDGDEWRLIVRWLGHGMAVHDAANAAMALGDAVRPADAAGTWKRLGSIEGAVDPTEGAAPRPSSRLRSAAACGYSSLTRRSSTCQVSVPGCCGSAIFGARRRKEAVA
jgi:glycolate oxidase subunit GlcD